MVVQFCENGALQSHLQKTKARKETIPLDRVLEMACQIATVSIL